MMHKTMELAIANLSRASLFEAYATLTAVSSLISQFNSQFVPKAVRDYVYSKFSQWFTTTSCRKDSFTLVIDEYSRATYVEPNLLFEACQEYLSDKLRDKATRLKGFRSTLDQSNVSYQLAYGEMFTETLENGIKLVWNYSCKNSKGEDVDVSSSRGETSRSFELTFDFCHKNEVLDGYIPSVLLKYYDQVIEMNKQIYLYTYQGVDSWRSVTFNHPFTFDSLALDPELKQSIIDDLDMFVRRKEFYNKVGKAWKRGYLLYGPPGTGKSSLVAAMANYLRFDVYDLQLGSVTSDQVLRRLMLSTSNKSILVIEDIDCTIGLSRALPSNSYDCNDDSGGVYSDDDREEEEDEDDVKNSKKDCQNKGHQKNNVNAADSQISLSGLLNFIDGLWSSCGDERIIIFTTNHKDRLDPAMLRPGRMDMHIHMSYLTMKGFMVLANNYLGVSGEHPLFAEIETLLKRVNVTPAQVAEQLIRNEDADIALSMVVKMLKRRYRKQCQKTKKTSKRKTRVVDSIEGNTNDNNGVSTTKGKRKRKVDSLEAKTNENGASKTEKATTTKKKVKPILLE